MARCKRISLQSVIHCYEMTCFPEARQEPDYEKNTNDSLDLSLNQRQRGVNDKLTLTLQVKVKSYMTRCLSEDNLLSLFVGSIIHYL